MYNVIEKPVRDGVSITPSSTLAFKNENLYHVGMKNRFMSKVVKTDSCWIWSGALRGKNGYGAFRLNGKTLSPHRVSYELFVGEIPKKMLVCHTCDNRLCVRPDHLFLGDHKANMVDAYKKQRIVVPKGSQFKAGSEHQASKLTEDDVREIRLRYADNATLRSLAVLYGVDHSLIWQIVRRKKWTHVE